MQLDGAVSLVTGAGSGMGAATARHLAGRGGKVVVVDLPSSAGEQVAADIGAAARFLPTDVTDPEAVTAAVDGAVEAFGRLDLVANCAGVADAARVLARDGTMFPLDLYRRVIDINLVGLFDVVRNAARVMAANEPNEDGERGVIVNIASIAGIEGQAGQAAYSGSKGGVIAMTLPLARDLASHGIRVNAICPGIFDTGMLAGTEEKIRQRLVDIHVFPKRLGRPEEVARLIEAMATNVMLNGEVVRLDAATRLAHG